MVAAAGAGVAAVDHEFLRAQPRLARLLVDDLGLVDELAPVRRRVDVDLDDAGIGRNAEGEQPRIAAGRGIALDEDRLAELLGRVLDGRDQLEIILAALHRRHEHIEMPVARLEGDRRAHDRTGRGTDGRLGAEVGRQRATPGLAAADVVVALRQLRHAAFLAAQQRRAAEGVERRQGGMGDHGIGIGDEAHIGRRGPGQRIERKTVAQR